MDTRVFIISSARANVPAGRIEGVRKVKTVIRSEELLLSAVSEALKSAPAGFARPDGIVVGVDNAIDSCKAEFYKEFLKDGPRGVSPLIFPYTSPNSVTAQATIAFGIRGTDMTTASGEVSFLKAMAYAYELIKNGLLDAVVAGGVSEDSAYAMVLCAGEGCKEGELAEIVNCLDAGLIEDCAGFAPLQSIEGSFAMMENALKAPPCAVKVVDKGGRGVVIDIHAL
ncbi:MAG: hypothetical protein HY884_07640 [Deltaproteobacteria bacterium]|nr:hypothetical protein [Deltaproteobacteria bacterium]